MCSNATHFARSPTSGRHSSRRVSTRGDSISSSRNPSRAPGSLPSGIGAERSAADAQHMSAAVLTKVAPTGSRRLLADVDALAGKGSVTKTPAFARLEAALGRDFADRLVAALSDKRGDPRR